MPKNIYQRGNGFQVKLKLRGHPERINQTFSNLRDAQLFIDACRTSNSVEMKRLAPGSIRFIYRPRIGTIEQLLQHVDKKRWGGNPNCKRPTEGSKANAQRFVDWVGPRVKIRDALSEYTIAAFIEERERVHQNSGSTINRYRAAIFCLVREALRLNLISEKPDISVRREGRPRERIFTEDEEALILSQLSEWGYEDHVAWFTFLADTACRSGEPQQLLWRDFVGKFIHFEAEMTKNSTRRTLSATPRVMAAVQRMREKYGSVNQGPFSWADPDLLATRKIWRRLREHFKWMGKDCLIYTFRHTCASRLVQRGADLYQVQIWMGHSSVQMTQRYAKFAPEHLSRLAELLSQPLRSASGVEKA